MKNMMSIEELKEFEATVIRMFEAGDIKAPIHLSGGNEQELIDIFAHVEKKDYVLSTHRNHYHYLLKGGDKLALLKELKGWKTGLCKGNGRSMNIYDPSIRFYTSAIVGGNCAMAVGIALALKKKKSKASVWCFLGDGAEDQGHFVEAARFAFARRLPLTFIIENNNRSVDSTTEDRWHNYPPINMPNILRYDYERIYPHVGIGKWVTF